MDILNRLFIIYTIVFLGCPKSNTDTVMPGLIRHLKLFFIYEIADQVRNDVEIILFGTPKFTILYFKYGCLNFVIFKEIKVMNYFKKTILTIISLMLLFSISVYSQENKEHAPNANFDEAERPDDSYQAKFHAQDISDKLIKRNLDQIYLINVIISNFGQGGWKSDYDKIYEEYKKGVEHYYKRDVIMARFWFDKNKQSIAELLKKMAEQYDKDAQSILDECHKQVIAIHMDQKTRSDQNRYRELIDNQERLRIAYGQMDDANSAYMDKNYEKSIYHYRVAKAYAIRILESVAYSDESEGKDGLKVKDVKEKYKKDKADNRNRIYEEAKRK